MMSTASIALSGMQAAQNQLDVTANNVANAPSPGYKRQSLQSSALPQGGVSTRVVQATTPGSALEVDLVRQLQAKHAYLANLAVFKSSNAVIGSLLDLQV